VAFDVAALRPLAKGAAGSMRDALSLLDQAIAHGAGEVREAGVHAMLGSVGQDHLLRTLDALIAGDAQTLVDVAAQIEARNLSFDSALQDLATLFHRIALLQFAPQALIDAGERDVLAPYAAAFDAEFLQLCYQITIHGRDELELAPDDYAGFVMTLLRLHAFEPGRSGSGARAAATAKPAVSRPAAVVPVRNAAQDAVPPAPTFEPVIAPPHVATASPVAANNDWHTLVAQLSLAGMAKQLAQHCEILSQTATELRLSLSPVHKHLLGKVQEDKLQLELQRQLGASMRMHIELTEAGGDTPAQRARNVARERQDRAIASIEQDPLVQDFVERFDASIDEASIKPL
jgi:DNA polymerase-3 subunit gamma/tau